MKQLRLVKTIVSCIVPALLVLYGCTGSRSSSVTTAQKDLPELRVGVSTNAPPLIYKNTDGITGLEVEFAQGLAKKLQRTLRLVPVKWQDQIPMLLAGKTDIIMSAMTVTASRSYRIAFTNSYMTTAQLPLVRRDDYNRLSKGFVDLLNPQIRIGTVKGTTGDFFVASNKARGARTVYPSSRAGVQALIDGNIDALVYDLPGTLYYASVYADKGIVPVMVPITRENIAWGVHPNNASLKQEADDYLESLRSTGKLQEMIERWVPFYANVFNSANQ